MSNEWFKLILLPTFYKFGGPLIKDVLCNYFLDPFNSVGGISFYPASAGDLTPLLLLPPKNKLGLSLITLEDLEDSPISNQVLPVLCEVRSEYFVRGDDQFQLSGFTENLWKNMKASLVSVELIGELSIGFYQAQIRVAEINRNGQICKYPFLFINADANFLFEYLSNHGNMILLSLIRCSGFSGSPSGECSKVISAKIKMKDSMRRPKLIVGDQPAFRHLENLLSEGIYRNTALMLRGDCGWDHPRGNDFIRRGGWGYEWTKLIERV